MISFYADEVETLTTAKDTQARQAEFLRGKLKESNEALEKLTKELQSKDAAFKKEKEQLEILLRGVVDSLSGIFPARVLWMLLECVDFYLTPLLLFQVLQAFQ